MKKVGQFGASRCKNSRELYFVCKHRHVVRQYVGCNSRFVQECRACTLKWRKKTVKRYSKHISKMKNPKLVTLTLKKGGRHRLEELPQLGHRFRKYLRRKGYEIKNFVSCLEPPNHVHGVWDCGYLPYKKLRVVWKEVTKDSFVVDIRKIKTYEDLVKEKMDKELRKKGVDKVLRKEMIDKEIGKMKIDRGVSKKKIDKQRWQRAVGYITKYITKISESGMGMRGLHVINSWGEGGYYKKFRMVCKICGSYFMPLWYSGQVNDFDNDAVEFVEINNDYG